MTTKAPPESARIYQFPARKHAPLNDRANPSASARGRAAAPTASTECGSGWYHDAAIEDAAKPRKP